MEDFVRKTRGVRDITSLPLDTSHELDIVSDVKGKIYIKILNRYKELLFDNGTEQWVIDMLNNLEVGVEKLKEDILDLEQTLSELPKIEDKLETVETKLAQINTLFAQMQIDVKGLDLRTAELEREVVQLALKDQELLDKINNLDFDADLDILYSNSTNFGEYDYIGNPNLMTPLKASNFTKPSGVTVEDVGNALQVTFTKTEGATFLESIPNIPALLPNTQYTLSADVTVSEGYTGKLDNLRFGYRIFPSGTIILPLTAKDAQIGKKTKISITANSSSITDPSVFYRMYFTIHTTSTDPFVGTVLVENIKVERGSTATPYQPNLLEDPYYLGKTLLGENLADHTKIFPIRTSENLIYMGDIKEQFTIGETYTLTMKSTKPSTQAFKVYNYGMVQYGTMKPVEGLTDVWQLTFTVSNIHEPYPSSLTIYQQPKETVGACQIDWLKIEKGDIRTPNIPYYKYFGINPVASKSPNDYQWIPLAKAAETVDARLTKTISTYDTVNALQNNRLTALESKVVDTTWQNVTVTKPFTSVTQPQVKKQNGIVYMRGTISNGTGDCFTLPEGFRPPEGAYEMQFRLPCRSADASDYATMYVRPSGLCSIAGVNGTKPIFLSGIIFSTT
ncbi:hypothetical protein [Enterococcus phage phiSHEF14]|nr:hypothetical protein [Enterococcus phage phiSHEF14]